jgi:hypothetical protein
MSMKIPRYGLCACLVAAMVVLGLGCEKDGGDDEGGDDSNDDGASSNGDGADEGGAACGDACAALVEDPQCAMGGFDEAACADSCSSDACAACLSESDACGTDCEAACAGGGSSADGSSADGSSDDASDDGNMPPPQCVKDDDCGISSECVACSLTATEGWCEVTMECSSDTDCGVGGKCGYNVKTSAYRCLEAEHCG